MCPLELWYELTFDRLERIVTTDDSRQRIRNVVERASRRTHDTMLPKLASRREGTWQIRDTPPGIFHVHGKTTLFTHDDDWLGLGEWPKLMAPGSTLFNSKSLGEVRGNLLAHFEMQDVAFKVVGVGSVGTRCLILLMVDPHEKPLFIQFKEASTSVISRYFDAPAPKHHGHRVVHGQRLMQGASDPFLGLDLGPFGRTHLRAPTARHEDLGHARTV